jgi:glycerophosphoryl diester phosphodiesterase
VIDLHRPDGRGPLRIGHRGAAHLAPENTLPGFREAVRHGCELIEFDVLDLVRGPLVLAHSDHLVEVSHGLAAGTVRDRTLERLREVAPDLPTLDEALAFFVDEAPDVGLHVDLKLRTRLDELVAAVARHRLEHRTVVSSVHVPSLHAVARLSTDIRIGLTYPGDRLGVSRRPALWPIFALGLTALRSSMPLRTRRMVEQARAGAFMLQHRLVTDRAVERSHALGVPVVAWTVDEPDELARLIACGVDAVVTNDPRIFQTV